MVETKRKKEKPAEDKSKINRENLFCELYIKNFNGKEAVIESKGWDCTEDSARTIASRLLSNVNIQNKIKKLLDKRKEKIYIAQEQILNELRKIAFADIGDININDGKIEFPEGFDTSIIKSMYISKNEKTGREQIKVQLHDKKGCLELLMRHFNMFGEWDPGADGSDVFIYEIAHNGRDKKVIKRKYPSNRKSARKSPQK
jgi:phage terminase small subunit